MRKISDPHLTSSNYNDDDELIELIIHFYVYLSLILTLIVKSKIFKNTPT